MSAIGEQAKIITKNDTDSGELRHCTAHDLLQVLCH